MGKTIGETIEIRMMRMENKKYEVSVAVVTYNADNKKLKMTLNSIIAQEKVDVQIVIGDDGSKIKDFDEIRKYFEEKNFTEYKIVENPINQGTVKNLLSAVEACTGQFVKPISPGDLLYSEDTLREWIDDMKQKGTKVGFGYTANYKESAGHIEPASARAFPQDTSVYAGEKNEHLLMKQYLLCEDICTGASTIVDTELMRLYLNKIVGKVKFAEDNVYRLMIFDGIKVSFLPKNVVLYEYGDGVSTSNNSIWLQRIRDDWNASSDIMLLDYDANNTFHKKFKSHIAQRDNGKFKKLLYYVANPFLMLFKIKTKIKLRKTEENISTEFYNKCKIM